MGTPGYEPYTTPGMPAMVPMPRRLHWGWVLALSILTRSFFGDIWLVVQSNWIERVTGRSEARKWAIINLCAIPLLFVGALAFGLTAGAQGFALANDRQPLLALQAVVGIIILALHVITVLKVRTALEEEPIGIPLGVVMTLFFGPVYFQYFLRDWMPISYSTSMPYPQHPYPTVPPPA